MKPTKRTIMVPLTYWECQNQDHRHKTEEIAQRCIDKSSTGSPRPSKAELNKRNIKAARTWLNGATNKAAAKSIGVSPERCRQIINKILRIARNPKRGLPPEPADAFTRTGVKPEYRDHYLMRVQAVADYWGV